MYQTNPNFIGKSKLFNQLIFAKQKKLLVNLKFKLLLVLVGFFTLIQVKLFGQKEVVILSVPGKDY